MSESPPKSTPEEWLLDYIKSLSKHRKNRMGFLLHFSRLNAHYRHPALQRPALDQLNILKRNFTGEIIELSNGDILGLFLKASTSALDDVVLNLRYLFEDDPLLQADDSAGDLFCDWFNVEKDYDTLLTLAKSRLANPVPSSPLASPEHKNGDAEKPGLVSNPHMRLVEVPTPEKRPIRLVPIETIKKQGLKRHARVQDFARIIEALSSIDINPLVGRQNVKLWSGGRLHPVFTDISLSVHDIIHHILPDIDFSHEPALVQHIRAIIDEKLLLTLDKIEMGNAIAINLRATPQAVLSPLYETFRKRSAHISNNQIIFEFSLQDILTDVESYLKARLFLVSHGHRIALGDMNVFSFCLVRRANVPPDFEKVRFSPSLMEDGNRQWLDNFKIALQRIGAHRITLTGVDDKATFDYGQSLGIALFQGKYIESL